LSSQELRTGRKFKLLTVVEQSTTPHRSEI
jgi:hypothetical protein